MICTLVKRDATKSPGTVFEPIHPSLLEDISGLTSHEREVIRALVDIMLAAREGKFQ